MKNMILPVKTPNEPKITKKILIQKNPSCSCVLSLISPTAIGPLNIQKLYIQNTTPNAVATALSSTVRGTLGQITDANTEYPAPRIIIIKIPAIH
jgi:hypothetical protein